MQKQSNQITKIIIHHNQAHPDAKIIKPNYKNYYAQ